MGNFLVLASSLSAKADHFHLPRTWIPWIALGCVIICGVVLLRSKIGVIWPLTLIAVTGVLLYLSTLR